MRGYRGNPYKDLLIMSYIVLGFCLILRFLNLYDFQIIETSEWYIKAEEVFTKYIFLKAIVLSVYFTLQYYLICGAILRRFPKYETIQISAYGIFRGIAGIYFPENHIINII